MFAGFITGEISIGGGTHVPEASAAGQMAVGVPFIHSCNGKWKYCGEAKTSIGPSAHPLGLEPVGVSVNLMFMNIPW